MHRLKNLLRRIRWRLSRRRYYSRSRKSNGCFWELAGCLGVLILLAAIVFGLSWLNVWINTRPEHRILKSKEFSKIEKVVLISFYCSPQIRYAKQGALPDEFKYHRDVEAARALSARHFSLWRKLAKRTPFEILDLEGAMESPTYQKIQGQTEILRSPLARNRPEYVSSDKKLWIIPLGDATDFAWLAESLGVDAVLVVSNEYSFELEPLAQKPWWMAVVTTSAFLVDRQGKLVWHTTRTRGESPKIKAESGINLVFFEMSKIPEERVETMFTEAMGRSWFRFSKTLAADLSAARLNDS